MKSSSNEKRKFEISKLESWRSPSEYSNKKLRLKDGEPRHAVPRSASSASKYSCSAVNTYQQTCRSARVVYQRQRSRESWMFGANSKHSSNGV